MATAEYYMLIDWAEKIGRAFSSDDAADALGIDASFARRLIDGAHSTKCIQRVGRAGDAWKFRQQPKFRKITPRKPEPQPSVFE